SGSTRGRRAARACQKGMLCRGARRLPRAATAARRERRRRFVDLRRLERDLQRAVSLPLELASDTGRRAVNAALSAVGSATRYDTSLDEGDVNRLVPDRDGRCRSATSAPRGADEQRPAEDPPHAGERGRPSSVFWQPYAEGSPFRIGREAFISKHLSQPVSGSFLLPDRDVEEYVDRLLSTRVLQNVSLPWVAGRSLYIRVVRIVQRVIINAVSMAEGDVLGKQLHLLKQKSERSSFRHSSDVGIDDRVIKLLAKRTLSDHVKDGRFLSPYLAELGLPFAMVTKLYEDIIALSFRLVLDVSMSFEIRCLGHTMTCHISSDDMLHEAPGWDVALEEGAFGIFLDDEKRRWAHAFVEDLMTDADIRVTELPAAVQSQVYYRVCLVMLNLAETALNHFRIHVAGMAFRPALLEGRAQN
ncbi:unnamed protein product, partial [Prorocentrum cordatum]